MVRLRLQVLEAQVLELVLDASDPQAVRERGIDILGFAGDGPPSLFIEVVDCSGATDGSRSKLGPMSIILF